MSNQLVMNITPFETRVAYIEGGRVAELFIERESEKGYMGNIYLGRVQRVLPGMQAAFINISLNKSAFLYVGDIAPHDIPEEEIIAAEGEAVEVELEERDGGEVVVNSKSNYSKKNKSKKRIEDMLQVGQKILVQVAKDPIGSKGPRVTCNISLPGRYVVLMPDYPHVGISKKIVEKEERERLKKLLVEVSPEKCGFVARTSADGVSEDILKADANILTSLWNKVQDKFKKGKDSKLLLSELDVVLKCARDRLRENLEKIIVDDRAAYEKVCDFLNIFDENLVNKVELYEEPKPIFERYNLEVEIERAMSRRVWLRSGGYLVMDQAEALTAIDVNTGKFVGRRNLEDTILKTNLEAVREIAFQLRLRNIGGMVIIDFIDMEVEHNRHRVLSSLVEALSKDKARCNVVKISELGLVEMTRQRTRESLERHLCEPCFYCDGKGSIKSKRTVAYDIFRAISLKASHFSEPHIVVQTHPEIADLLQGEELGMLQEIGKLAGKEITVTPRGSFHQEQFDVYGTTKG